MPGVNHQKKWIVEWDCQFKKGQNVGGTCKQQTIKDTTLGAAASGRRTYKGGGGLRSSPPFVGALFCFLLAGAFSILTFFYFQSLSIFHFFGGWPLALALNKLVFVLMLALSKCSFLFCSTPVAPANFTLRALHLESPRQDAIRKIMLRICALPLSIF